MNIESVRFDEDISLTGAHPGSAGQKPQSQLFQNVNHDHAISTQT